MNSYRSLEHNTKGEPESVVSLAKWRILNRLHDRNETLYYRVRYRHSTINVPDGTVPAAYSSFFFWKIVKIPFAYSCLVKFYFEIIA